MNNFEFESIYQIYVRKVFTFLLKLSGNYYIAEELTQETFSRAYSNIDKFRGECKLFIWLCQIGKNLYYDFIRNTQKETYLSEIEFLVDDFNIEEKVIKEEEIQDITKKILKLQEPYQSVFIFRIYLELSYQEIGNIFQKSDNWARVTFYRAKIIIQKQLKEIK